MWFSNNIRDVRKGVFIPLDACLIEFLRVNPNQRSVFSNWAS